MLSSNGLQGWIGLIENEQVLGSGTGKDRGWIKMVIIIRLRWEWMGSFQKLQGHIEHLASNTEDEFELKDRTGEPLLYCS